MSSSSSAHHPPGDVSKELGNTTPQLQLTEAETELFRKLIDACDKLGLKTTVPHSHTHAHTHTHTHTYIHTRVRAHKVRVAGGWVRDKLLGLPSDDIDLALDDMMGEEV